MIQRQFLWTVGWLLLTGALMASEPHHWPSPASDLPASLPPSSLAGDEEMVPFPGPFYSWANLQEDFGAKGNGYSDDTKALQRALDALGPGKGFGVLYLPPGVYRITDTLQIRRAKDEESKDFTILGAGPETTLIRWDGKAGHSMLQHNGWYARLGRLTFDGAGRAGTAIAMGARFSTYNEFHDLVIQDVEFGIEGGEGGKMTGQGIAETVVRRCVFLRCSKAGLSLQNWNSLDWFVWRSLFQDCHVGIGNIYGAGNFHAYSCRFSRSTWTDLAIGNTGYFSFRNNYSTGSRSFFVAKKTGACAQITLQDNIVEDTAETPVQIGCSGSILLLDNLFNTPQGVVVDACPQGGLDNLTITAVGNHTRSEAWISDAPPGFRYDNKVWDGHSLPIRPLPAPLIPPQGFRPVFEVPVLAATHLIQEQINRAAALTGQRPLVHLPAGVYRIDQTLVIPPDCDLELLGDGGRTMLKWTGGENQPVLQINGPSRVRLSDFNIHGGNRANGLEFAGCDQPLGRIRFDQAQAIVQHTGLRVEGMLQTRIELENFYHYASGVGVQVQGVASPSSGPASALGAPVVIQGGASANNELSYALRDNGYLVVRDIWYETKLTNCTRFLNSSGRGVFSLHSAMVAPKSSSKAIPVIQVDNYEGGISFLQTQLAYTSTRVRLNGAAGKNPLLWLGTFFNNEPETDTPDFPLVVLDSFRMSGFADHQRLPERMSVTPEKLLALLEPIRQVDRGIQTPADQRSTDIQLHRVHLERTRTALSISGQAGWTLR